jgi:F0F1-type ATP synthase delta subunit
MIRDIDYYLSERGVVLASIVSAYALSEATKHAITEMISQTTGAHTIELEQHLDAAVLGGVRISIPGRRLDATIARRLHQLTTHDN